MILMTSLIVKILIVTVILFVFLWFYKEKLSHFQIVCLGCLLVLFSLISSAFANSLPPLTEEVTLTALSEKNDNSKNAEIFLEGFTIDGENYSSGKSLQIASGHWFWAGETYAWRPETDPHQPKGVTKTVVLKIPVGWNRTLNFMGEDCRGKVAIAIGENTKIVDTYALEEIQIKEPIGRSDTSKLIFNQICYLLSFMVIFVLFSAVLFFLIYKAIFDSLEFKEFVVNNIGKIFYGGIAVVTFILMLYGANRISLWVDELAQISFSNGSFAEAMYYCLTMREVSPPLPNLVFTFWYHIAPYGERWLLLITIIFSVISIYFMGLIGEKLYGKFGGISAALFMAWSKTMWINVAYEYRAYPLLVLFSTLTLYCYLGRNSSGNQKKWNMLLSISMVGMTMSHYFGMLACAIFFLADIYLFFQKKITKKELGFYFLPGIISIVWLASVAFVVTKNNGPRGAITWQPVPDISHIKGLFQFLSGNQEIAYWFLILGIAISITHLVYKRSSDFWERFYSIFFSVIILGSVLLLVVWGNFISRKYTMWADRYFLFLMPEVCALSAFVIYKCGMLFETVSSNCKISCIVTILIGISLPINCLINVLDDSASSLATLTDPYRQISDWIYTQSTDIFNEDTLIISTAYNAIEGWNEYYFSRQGRRDLLNIKYQSITNAEILKYNKIYVFRPNVNSRVQKLLNENYCLNENPPDIDVKVYSRNNC